MTSPLVLLFEPTPLSPGQLYHYDFGGSHGPEERYNILDSMAEDDEDDIVITDTHESVPFDYSLLPEIPRRVASVRRPPVPRPLIPSNSPVMPEIPRFTLHSSPLKTGSTLSVNLLGSVLRARLEEELPPLPLDLPQLPFSALLLLLPHLEQCGDVWVLGNVYRWCLKLKLWLHGGVIVRKEFRVALMKVVVFQCPDVPVEIIWKTVDAMIGSLIHQEGMSDEDADGMTIHDRVGVLGVFPELAPCYATDHNGPLHCYALQCAINRVLDQQRRLLEAKPTELVLGDDWALYWKLTPEELKLMDRDELKKQSLIFDLFRSEQKFILRGQCFLRYACRQFFAAAKLLVPEIDLGLLAKFESQVYQLAHQMVELHNDMLLTPLIQVLIAEGKFIRSVGTINNLYKQWAHAVKQPLLTYMLTVPMIQDLLSNPSLNLWMDDNVNNQDQVKQLQVNGLLLFLLVFNLRYQHLPLQLEDLKSKFDVTELLLFVLAVYAIEQVAVAVNDRKRYADNRYGLTKLTTQLEWRNVTKPRNLNLELENRKVFYRGDMFKMGDLKLKALVVHLVLLDNFFFVCKLNARNKFEVTEQPIPVELLLVEERETGAQPLIGRNNTSTLVPTVNSVGDEETDPVAFPFKVRYAGWGKHFNYTFYSKVESSRHDFVKVYSQARSYLFARRNRIDQYLLEPVATTQFAYEANKKIVKLPVCAEGDPVYAAANEAKQKLSSFGIRPPQDIYLFELARNNLCFSKVLCSDHFAIGQQGYCFIGTNHGLYAWDYANRWRRILLMLAVSKIQVILGLGIVLVLANKLLRYYSLRSLINVYNGEAGTYSNVVTALKILNDPVTFFEFGKHRDMPVLFFAKHKSNNLYLFKALVPEVDLGTVFSRFREVKKFYVQAECYGMTLFNTTFAIHTNKGVEVMFLDDLKARQIPIVPSAVPKLIANMPGAAMTIDTIRRMTQKTSLEPLGMYKLRNNSEFLLVYTTCAIFTDKKGTISRGSLVNFHHRALRVSFDQDHLIVVCEEAVEIWQVSPVSTGTSKLVQVITGKGICLLNSTNLTISMANPMVVGMQLVMNLKKGTGM